MVFLNKQACFHIINADNLIIPQTDEENTNYVIIDTDLAKNNLDKIITTYKKYKTKIFAYTQNTSKENILKLYSLGLDNVTSTPIDINDLIQNIINPDNKDVNIKNAEEYKKSKKILILSDDKLNTELLLQTFCKHNFIYTIRPTLKAAETDIKKDIFDLIIIDFKSINNEILNIANITSNSTLNKKTPLIYLCPSTEQINELKKQNFNCVYYCIEKPYTPNILLAEIQNILKIKELQDELKKENDLLESMISNSFNQLVITDSNFIILSGGNQHIPIFKNEYFFNTLKHNKIDFPTEEIRIFSRNSEKKLKFQSKYKDQTFEFVISKVANDINLFDKYLIVIENITENLLIEEQKETFIATLTHDLKSPIRAEQNILKQMLNGTFGDLNETQKTILNEILKSREYENKMIDNLLTRYHSTETKINLLIEKNSYKETIKTALNETQHLFNNKEQNITLKYNATTDIFDFDKTEIKRVLANLLQNASEYTQKNGKIIIEVDETQSNILTSVKDNGYGISQEDLTNIFDKNVTLAKKYRKVGAGLGLYICKTLINAHNGEISAKSKENKGSEFIFTLPKTH